MIPKPVYLLPAALVLAACTSATAEHVRSYAAILADSDRQMVRPGPSAPIYLGEAPLFPIDRNGPAAAMTADTQSRKPAAPAPRALAEEPPPR